MIPVSPPNLALIKLSANLYPAYAMLSVADPAPSFALTTSSPPNWIRLMTFSYSAVLLSSLSSIFGSDCESSGTIVAPECPPTTGILYLGASVGMPSAAVTKVEARTMSRVVTPNRLGDVSCI